MKIYNKKSFVWGIVFLCPAVLFALGIVEADWWQWLITLALSAKFLYPAFSKDENARQNKIESRFESVSKELYGKNVKIKLDLPWILTIGFFAAALFVRLVFDTVIPVGLIICFAIALPISAMYSIGLNREIVKHIDEERDSGDENSI